MNKNSQYYIQKNSYKRFKTHLKRRRLIKRKKASWFAHVQTMQLNIKDQGLEFHLNDSLRNSYSRKLPPIPEYPQNIKFFLEIPELFSRKVKSNNKLNGHLILPKCFSLLDNYEESFDFLKELFITLHEKKHPKITLDYKNCKRIDVDASICMDVLLAEFIHHFKQCRKLGHKNIVSKGITPINIESEKVLNVLFSIGAYRNISGFTIKNKNFIPLPVLINDNRNPDVWSQSEVALTKIVEYIKSCIKKLNKELSSESENEFYKVIGEIMSNALEHGTMRQCFSIGFFEEHKDTEDHHGIFNFSIFNFGDTIYQSFNKEDCPNQRAVNQMRSLSEAYTKKGLFNKSKFEEETLWTLYALQEGVTSKPKKRGNGSIQYIENFFRLKGDLSNDNMSRMAIISGNTRIMFDGTYNIEKKENQTGRRPFKTITFNKSGNIDELPDEKFVSFAPHYFPGTIISSRILIKFDNISTD